MGLLTLRECPEAYDELLRVSARHLFSFLIPGGPTFLLGTLRKTREQTYFYTEALSIIRPFDSSPILRVSGLVIPIAHHL